MCLHIRELIISPNRMFFLIINISSIADDVVSYLHCSLHLTRRFCGYSEGFGHAKIPPKLFLQDAKGGSESTHVETNTYLELIHAYITTYIEFIYIFIRWFPSISHVYIYLSIDILRICRLYRFILFHICCTKIRAVGPTLAERALHGSRARLLRGERVVGLVDSVGLRNRGPLLFVAVYSEKNCWTWDGSESKMDFGSIALILDDSVHCHSSFIFSAYEWSFKRSISQFGVETCYFRIC